MTLYPYELNFMISWGLNYLVSDKVIVVSAG